MAASKGKNFERQFKQSAEKDGLFILRLNDSSLSWEHERNSRFACDSPCDFIMFYKGHLIPLELKSTEYSSMSIQMEDGDKSKMIKMHQWNALSNFGMFEGVCPGFILNFRDKKSTYEETYWVPIKEFIDFISSSGKKSINKNDVAAMNNVIKMNQILKKVNYKYQVKELFDELLGLSNTEGGKDG